jgi:electron transfer flavoprotein alpha subunit
MYAAIIVSLATGLRQGVHCQRLEPAADLFGAMAVAIKRLASDGWEAAREA